ncbi:unnamed protein product [Lepeophtheirus salmonis]|uniref:(salmon louse) hypothetical protein n=1 Tax=Lepeophtheirus salmonis TaxID=72036 RepID=A0A7R8H1X1_LEPSM|nr:unnamed protein product [Lepeophtheirus salmonis]CAF2817682.1 unnamed protein product [Lepeophtheirus salmonis]
MPNSSFCNSGWKGIACSLCIPLPGCQHGICKKPYECICEKGYQGVLCNKPQCDNCKHGRCIEPNKCFCDFGWKGNNCDECKLFPNCKNGTCFHTFECNCNEGFKGLFCNISDSYGSIWAESSNTSQYGERSAGYEIYRSNKSQKYKIIFYVLSCRVHPLGLSLNEIESSLVAIIVSILQLKLFSEVIQEWKKKLIKNGEKFLPINKYKKCISGETSLSVATLSHTQIVPKDQKNGSELSLSNAYVI